MSQIQMQMMMEQQSKIQRRAQIPNLLTLGRIVMALVFVALLGAAQPRTISTEQGISGRVGELTQGSTTLLIVAAGIFVIAALTDALDGHLARKWDVVSKFGRIADPLADKLLILGGFIMLAGPAFTTTLVSGASMQISGVAGWMVVLMLGRELLVTSIRGVYEGEGVDFSAGFSGKAKMVLQSITVPLILLLVALGSPGPESSERTVILFLVWGTLVVTLFSALPYIGKALQHTVDQQAKMLEVMRGKKARKPTKSTSVPGAKQRKKSSKGGQTAKGKR